MMPSGSAPGARHVAGRLGHGRLAPLVGVERHQPVVAVHADRHRERLAAHPEHAGVAAGAEHGEACTVESYCSYTHRLLAIDGRVEEGVQRGVHPDPGRRGGASPAGARPRRGASRASGDVDRAVVHQRLAGNCRHGQSVVLDPEEAVVGHVTDRRRLQLPLLADRLDGGAPGAVRPPPASAPAIPRAGSRTESSPTHGSAPGRCRFRPRRRPAPPSRRWNS